MILQGENKGRVLIVATALLWGLAGVCVKSVTWSAMSIVAVRSFFAVIILFFSKKSVKIRFSKINVIGALTVCVESISYLSAVKLTTAGSAIVIQYVAPILVFIWSCIAKRKKPKPSEALIVLAVFAGIALSFSDGLDMTRMTGNLLALLSGFAYAAQIVIMADERTDATDVLIISCILSTLIALPFTFFDRGLTFSPENIIWLAVLCIFQYGLSNIFFAKGIRLINGVEASLLLTVEPIFNPILAAIICGEKMGLRAIIGAGMVIFFVTLYSILPNLTSNKKTLDKTSRE